MVEPGQRLNLGCGVTLREGLDLACECVEWRGKGLNQPVSDGRTW